MNGLSDHQKYYDERWEQQGFANSLQAARCAAILSALHRVGIKDPRILDLGCGTGWLSAILGHFGPTTAVDLSDFAVKVAAKKFPWVEFCQGDIFEWSRKRNADFDVVVSQEVIEHVYDQAGYLEIATRLLKDRRYLILTTPNARTIAAMRNASAWSNQPLEKVLTVGTLRSLVSRHFEIIDTTTIVPGFGDTGIYRLLNSEKIGYVLDFLKARTAYRKVLLRAAFGLHTVVIARKK
jgi:2-polyprenyl-3-methyl-5-hydroxy-6-metoxy-1,4-benzoquinol methylase